MAYKGIYFQKEKEGSLVKESVSDFGIWCKDFPFKIHGDAKELANTEWSDEDGDDEFIPDVIRLKSYEISVEFAYKGVSGSANEKIRDFLDYLTGRDGSGASLKVYDSFTGIGRKNVRFMSVSQDGEYVRSDAEGDVFLFKVTFKVNDPVTDIILTK
ncbi:MULTISPECIES: hypothetical protein [Butyricimonas]|uniref:hypothetical protein n=1 Tax=Butyricimonas TaxID=574697 RepID=UPI0007FB26F1|nr:MULTISPECIES: hypothetical protein [Butyricimonas]